MSLDFEKIKANQAKFIQNGNISTDEYQKEFSSYLDSHAEFLEGKIQDLLENAASDGVNSVLINLDGFIEQDPVVRKNYIAINLIIDRFRISLKSRIWYDTLKNTDEKNRVEKEYNWYLNEYLDWLKERDLQVELLDPELNSFGYSGRYKVYLPR